MPDEKDRLRLNRLIQAPKQVTTVLNVACSIHPNIEEISQEMHAVTVFLM